MKTNVVTRMLIGLAVGASLGLLSAGGSAARAAAPQAGFTLIRQREPDPPPPPPKKYEMRLATRKEPPDPPMPAPKPKPKRLPALSV